MLIVISNPTPIANEANLLNALFDEGLQVLHLRKPEAKDYCVRKLIEKITSTYHQRIALHQHHDIAKEYNIMRLHFTEMKRNEMNEETLQRLREEDIVLSTSIHIIKDYKQLSSCFSYTFFGPVFNSISKKGYTSTLADGFVFPVEKDRPKVIALGGIDAANIEQAMDMKFDGVAVLGTIWQKPDESIQQFKDIQKAWKQADR